MEEKGIHIIYQNNAIKIICLDKKEILRQVRFWTRGNQM